jgi:phosphohistidine phosphatase
MNLYILRHADAEPHCANDAERRLTGKGEQQASQVARFCEAHGLKVDVVLTSPFRRARQTAKPVAEHLGVEMREEGWLASGAEPADVIAKLADFKKMPAVMIVGHEPDLGRLISHLLGAKGGEAIHVRKASLTALEVLALREGGARLDFSVPVKFM